jgi:predicted nucleic acid-binding protein
MMDRTTILLPPGLRERASRHAKAHGKSLAELIRDQLAAAVAAEADGADPWLDDLACAGGPPAAVPEAPRLPAGALWVAADALVARHWAGHPDHPRLARAWAAVRLQRPALVTSALEVAAALTELARVTDPGFAAERGRHLALARHLEVATASADDHHAALDWLARYRDPQADFTRCLSFTLASRHRVAGVLTAAAPYRWAGFTLVP